MEYTDKKLQAMYNSYERVRTEGRFNMFSNQAMMLSGLSKEDYVYVMENYSELREKFGGK